eukprot:6021222-Pyramimonas_sp.AAC.1
MLTGASITWRCFWALFERCSALLGAMGRCLALLCATGSYSLMTIQSMTQPRALAGPRQAESGKTP